MTYPNPAEAMAKSIEYFEAGDRDAARYWLDVAGELRAGWRDKSQGYVRSDAEPEFVTDPGSARAHYRQEHADTSVCEHEPYASLFATQHPDATAVLNAVTDDRCPSCGGETISFNGTTVHHSTYAKECEFATAGR